MNTKPTAEHAFWHRQTIDQPLFPDLLWSKPENKNQAGKLLIIGGSLHSIAAPAEAYAAAEKAGIGTARVLLPNAVHKLVGFLENAHFAPSTPSGSFAQNSLADMLEHAESVDGILIAGDTGRNAETAIVLEKFVATYKGPLTITKDAADYFQKAPLNLLKRTGTNLVVSLAQLQKFAQYAQFTRAIVLGMDLINLVNLLHEFTLRYSASIITKHHDQIIVAHNGQISTTKLSQDLPIWRVQTAAHIAVWSIHNPSQLFEANSCAILTNNIQTV